MKTQFISNKKCCDKGGGEGFGWKYSKVKKYVCMKTVEDRFGDSSDFSEVGRKGDTTTTQCNNTTCVTILPGY